MEKNKLKSFSLQYNSSCVHDQTKVASPIFSFPERLRKQSSIDFRESDASKTYLQSYTTSDSDAARNALPHAAICSILHLHKTNTVSKVASVPDARSVVSTEAVTLNQPY
jgi:hypothetical protein